TGTSVLTLSVDPTVTTGSYPLTVTGTDGTLTHATGVTLVVTPPPDFALSASPATVSAAQGTSGTSTITVTPQNGFGGPVTLSVTGVPAGASASFGTNPTTGSSVLTLGAGTAAAGPYTLTVTGTSGALSHTTSVSFVVTAAQPASFSLAVTPASLTVQHG